MTPPLQLQTVHGRRAQLANVGIGTVVVGILVLTSTEMPASAKLFVGLFTLAIVSANNLLRLRFSGLFLEDGRIVSRRFFFDRSTNAGPALASLSLRPWFVTHQVMAKGDVPYGVPAMLRFGSMVPSWLSAKPNELLVRSAPVHGERKRGPWEPTGIVWSDDDAFLSALTTYVDAALGTDPAAAAPPSATRTLVEAAYPEFRTAHSFGHGAPRTLILLAYACAIFGAGCMIYGLASGAVGNGDLGLVTAGFVPAAFGVGVIVYARNLGNAVSTLQRLAPPAPTGVGSLDQALLTGVMVKHGRLVTGATFITPGKLTIAQQGGITTVAAVSTRGKTHPLPMLSNDPANQEPNELLIRHPKAPQASAAQWQGTGIFWGADGAAILAHLEQTLQGSRGNPANDEGIRDAA